mmetsp:Transcript_6553/g.4702  ORF Transcript_6553/g.4702 Transcript_6553/m.4702 type:complete len:85 (-) Transcript_6553:194-448(-)
MNLFDSVCGSGIESGLAASFSSAFINIGDFFHIDGEVYAEETNCDNMDSFPALGDLGTQNFWAYSEFENMCKLQYEATAFSLWE